MKLKVIIFSLLIIALYGCQQKPEQQHPVPNGNAIYHWKSTFNPTADDIEFLRKHNIRRIYMKMFDVAVEKDVVTNTIDVVPVATTKFLDSIPDGIEIVPTVYITIDALRAINDLPEVYGDLIATRIKAMASYNSLGDIKEVQLDCDWTESTRDIYFDLCRSIRYNLGPGSFQENDKATTLISSTIRLHQLDEQAPPVDRGVLMLYNTGNIKDTNTKNSILDPATVKAYMNVSDYDIPLSFAYPAFGWSVIFQDGKFKAITANPDSIDNNLEGISIRHERPTAADILATKSLVEDALGQPNGENIIYHLDSSQLSNYTDDEINKIYSRN